MNDLSCAHRARTNGARRRKAGIFPQGRQNQIPAQQQRHKNPTNFIRIRVAGDGRQNAGPSGFRTQMWLSLANLGSMHNATISISRFAGRRFRRIRGRKVSNTILYGIKKRGNARRGVLANLSPLASLTPHNYIVLSFIV